MVSAKSSQINGMALLSANSNLNILTGAFSDGGSKRNGIDSRLSLDEEEELFKYSIDDQMSQYHN